MSPGPAPGPGPAPVLRRVEAAETAAAVGAVLAGGAPIAPLPLDPVERARAVALLDQPASLPPGTAAVITTSGSTGTPKGVFLSRRALLASAAATHSRLGGPRDWVLALPTHHVAGLMVVVRAATAGTQLLTVPPDLTGLPDAVAGLDRPYIALVPTQLRRALDRPELAAALARCASVLLGGGPADAGLLAAAAKAHVRVITTYGMSETCGGCVYDGQPLDGVTLELTGDRIRLRGPMLFSGYWSAPELTAAALSDGSFLTGDRGQLVDGRLEVLGRIDDVVISGGLNVDLAAVERLARSWPGRDRGDLAVVGVPDPEWGTRVVAAMEGPADPGTAELRAWLHGRLPSYAAPRELIGLATLPRTSAGKIDRPALVALLSGEILS